ncbi:Bromodomain-containing protein [Flagelloscypha sp. PMI_526]|nr:Bromodomain-containing protein [Flagelloscypha sp. PMI_526]
MLKRGISQVGSPSDAEGSRKRRKETESGPNSDELAPTAAPSSADALKAQSVSLWQTAMEYTNKEGRVLSPPFVKRPSKRIYPDYYKAIANPIGLEDIKKTIDDNRYPRLEHVKAALDLCFENCMNYNMDGSGLYIDAKELKKAVNKAYQKLIGGKKEATSSKKQDKDSKSLNLIRLLKSRLQTLIELSDDDGRVISQLFLELPNKKEWSIYYEHIKNPISFEEISKKIKQKKYESVQQFADDVELLCSNAFKFNEDGSDPYKDAKRIQIKFQEIMADLPEPFALAKYTRPKIKLKLPGNKAASQPSSAGPSTLETPIPSTPKPQKLTGVAPPRAIRLPPKVETPTSISAPATLASRCGCHCRADHRTQYSHSCPCTYPFNSECCQCSESVAWPCIWKCIFQGVYGQQPAQTPSFAPAVPINATVTKLTASKVGLTLPKVKQPLKRVMLKTEPSGRIIQFHRDEGVQTWMMRLSSDDRAVSLFELIYIGDEDDEDDMDVDEQPQRRPRGRPPKSPAAKAAALAKANAKVATPRDIKVREKIETQVKLNSVVMPDRDEQTGAWYLDLVLGPNLIEMGGLEGTPWKIHIERMENI